MSETKDELLEAFDAGEDMSKYFDFDKGFSPNREMKRVNVDFPVWMLRLLDREAARLGINRQAVIKTWIAERLDQNTQLPAAA